MLQDWYITSLGRSRTTRTDLKSYFEDQVFEQRKSVSNFGIYIPLILSGHPQFPLFFHLVTIQWNQVVSVSLES